MADVRMLLAIALQSSDLSSSDTEETHLDRILAMGHASALGSALWRLRLANDRRSFQPAVLLLSERMRRPHERRSMREKVASCAIMEWLDDICRRCWGRGMMVAKDTPVLSHVCTICEGTGRKRYSDNNRARALGLGVDVARKWETRFAKAHSLITSADRDTWVRVAISLERITGKAGTKEKVLQFAGLSGIVETSVEDLPVSSDRPAYNENSSQDQRSAAQPVLITRTETGGRVPLEPEQLLSTGSPAENAIPAPERVSVLLEPAA